MVVNYWFFYIKTPIFMFVNEMQHMIMELFKKVRHIAHSTHLSPSDQLFCSMQDSLFGQWFQQYQGIKKL